MQAHRVHGVVPFHEKRNYYYIKRTNTELTERTYMYIIVAIVGYTHYMCSMQLQCW